MNEETVELHEGNDTPLELELMVRALNKVNGNNFRLVEYLDSDNDFVGYGLVDGDNAVQPLCYDCMYAFLAHNIAAKVLKEEVTIVEDIYTHDENGFYIRLDSVYDFDGVTYYNFSIDEDEEFSIKYDGEHKWINTDNLSEQYDDLLFSAEVCITEYLDTY